MVKVVYGFDGIRRHTILSLSEKLQEELDYGRIDLSGINNKIHALNLYKPCKCNNGSEILDAKAKREYLSKALRELPEHIRRNGSISLDYQIVLSGEEPFIQINCRINGQELSWIPRELKLPKKVRSALEDLC